MDGLTRWIPRLTIVTAILHFILALTMPSEWAQVANEGFVNTIRDGDAVRGFDLWFLLGGVGLLGLGTLGRWAVRTTGRLPGQIGVYLLVIGVLVTVVQPVSGGPVLVILGALALVAARRQTPVRPELIASGTR